jgi:glucoamylase
LQRVSFQSHRGPIANHHLYVLLAPHLGNHGEGNNAWLDQVKGTQLLFAQRGDCALALACSAPWVKRSAGFVGTSDGWTDLKAHHEMTWEYQRAEGGNVALTGEIDLIKSHGSFVLSLGFGKDPDEAAHNAIASLRDGFDKAKHDYVAGWHDWMKTHPSHKNGDHFDLSSKSLAVVRTHESKFAPGALIASLAIPWGFNKGDQDQGGYHLVWARDMVETAGALLAAGAHQDVHRVLAYLQKTQQSDGHWPQNMWLDGKPYWHGIQMDETALPILLVDLARREQALTQSEVAKFWTMVKNAASYLARNGPVSPQDRWEEDPGYTPFTVAAEISALLAAADLGVLNQKTSIAGYLREIADTLNTFRLNAGCICQLLTGAINLALTVITCGSRRSRAEQAPAGCSCQECCGVGRHAGGEPSHQPGRAGLSAFWFARCR